MWVTIRTGRAMLTMVAPLLVVGIAAGSVAGRKAWLERQLHELLTVEAARVLDREVRIGEVEGNLRRGIVLRDVAVAREGGFGVGEELAAEEISVSYDLEAIAKREVAPARGISDVVVKGARLEIVRDADGEVNLTKLVPEGGPPAPPEERFAGKVRLENADIIYRDETITGPDGAPFEQHLQELDAEVDMSRPDWIAFAATTTAADDAFGQAEVSGSVSAAEGFFSVDVAANDVPAKPWYDFHAAQPNIDVLGGNVDLVASVYRLPEGEGAGDVRYHAVATLHDVGVEAAEFLPEPVRLSGEVQVTPEGLEITDGRLAMGDVTGTVDGRLIDFSDPVIDAQVVARHVTWEMVQGFLPDDTELVPPEYDLSLHGEATVQARLAGRLDHGNVQATVDFPGTARLASEGFSTIKGRGLTVEGTLVDWASPDLTATVHVQELTVGAIQLRAEEPPDTALDRVAAAGEPAGPEQLRLEPLRDVTVDFAWQDGHLVAAGALQAASIGLDDLEITDVQGRYVFADGVLRLDDLQAELMDGRLVGGGTVLLGEGDAGPSVRCSAELEELRLDSGDPPLGLDLPVAGTINGRVALELASGAVSVVGHATMRQGSVLDRPIDSIEALFTATEDGVHIDQARLVDPKGVAWATGDIGLVGERELDLTFAASDLDLAELTRGKEDEEPLVTGVVYADGTVKGTLDEPRAEIAFEAFDVGHESYEADLAVGRCTLTYDTAGGRLSVHTPAGEPLLASHKALGVAADLHLSDYVLEEQDGEIEGEVRLAGATIGELLALAEEARGEDGEPLPITADDLSGRLSASAQFSGTVAEPEVTGTITLDDGWLYGYPVERAHLPLALHGDVLALSDGWVHLAGARVGLSGQISDLREEARADLAFSALDVPLEGLLDLATQQGWLDPAWALRMDGALNVTKGKLTGPLTATDDLELEAEISLAQAARGGDASGETALVIEGEAITDLLASVRYADQVAAMDRLSFGLAGGTVTAAGAYDLETGEILAHFEDTAEQHCETAVRFESAALPRVLRLIAPFAAIASGERQQASEGGPGLTLYSLAKRTEGVVDAEVRVNGRPDDPQGEAHFEVVGASVDGRELPGVRGDLQLSGGRLTDVEVVAELPRPAATDETVGQLERSSLVRLTGDLDWENGPVRARLEGFAVNLDDLMAYLPRRGGRARLSGLASFEFAVGGTITDPEVQGWLMVDSPVVSGARFGRLEAPYIALLEDTFEVRDLALRRGGEQVQMDALIPLGGAQQEPLRVAARLEQTDLSILPPLVAEIASGTQAEQAEESGLVDWLRRLKAEGSISSNIEVTGTLEQPMVRGELSVANGALSLLKWAPAADDEELPGAGEPPVDPSFPAIRDINLDIAAKADPSSGASEITLKQFGLDVENTEVEVSGRARLTRFALDELAENEYDLKVACRSPEQRLGSAARLTDIDGLLAFRTDERGVPVLEIDHVTARAGAGKVAAKGSVGVTEFAPSRLAYNDWDVTLDIDDADIDYRAKGWFGSTTIYKGPFWTHAEIKSTQPGAPARITGRSRIHHCFLSTPPLKPSKGEKPEREGLYAAGPGVPNFDLDWRLDVGDVVQYRGSRLDARLMRAKDAVVLTGTPQEPDIKGQLEYQSGLLTIYGNAKFRIEKLRIEAQVAPATLIRWIQAEQAGRPVREPPYQLGYNVRVTGRCRTRVDAPGDLVGRPGSERLPVDVIMEINLYTADEFDRSEGVALIATPTAMVAYDDSGQLASRGVTIRTEPPIDQDKLLSLLGAPAVGAGGDPLDVEARIRGQMLGILANELRLRIFEPAAEGLRKVTGLDELTVNFTMDQPVELTLGKYLIKDVLVTYRRPFGGAQDEYDLRLSYRASGKSYVTVATDETEQVSVQFQWTQPVGNWGTLWQW